MATEIPDVLSLCDVEAKAFFDSFDTIVTDCDGVLWNLVPLPGTKKAIQRMKELGKNIYHVSNNAARTTEDYETLCSGVGINLDDVITPATAIIQYLQSINYNGKKIFALATDVLKEVLIKAGFQIAAEPAELGSSFGDFLKDTDDNDPEIKIVLIDVNLKFNYQSLLKAISILKRPDVVYLAGASDRYLPVTSQRIIPGPGFFIDIIADLTERHPIHLAKPSEWLRDIVMRNFNITDARRTLFIGDMLKQDMGFASICGFQKLLVLSGAATLKAAEECVNLEYRPDYYIQSLGHLSSVMDKLNI